MGRGNGNVGQVLDATDTQNIAVDAQYEYDPFGRLIVTAGDYADANPFRFSTKWLDTELAGVDPASAVGPDGLSYYGYRFYSPNLGRWINRDPIGEGGDINLYGFGRNAPLNMVDIKGLFSIPTITGGCYSITVSKAGPGTGKQTGPMFGKCPAFWITGKSFDDEIDEQLKCQLPKTVTKKCKSGACKGITFVGKSIKLPIQTTSTFYWRSFLGFPKVYDDGDGDPCTSGTPSNLSGWNKCTIILEIEAILDIKGYVGLCCE